MLIRVKQFLVEKKRSLAFRILFYFILAMIVFGLILGFNFANRLKPHFKNEVLPNIARYLEYVLQDIGEPPDIDRAGKLAAELPFEMRIEGPGVNWSSRANIRPISTFQLYQAPHPYRQFKIGSRRHGHYVLTERGGYQYLFVVDNQFHERFRYRQSILFLLLGGTLVILYFFIRRLLRPVGIMSNQVSRIGAGEFDQQLEVKGNDDLSKLANGINNMSVRIKSMLDAKAALLLAISHELRSPITRMRVNIELLENSSTRFTLIDDIKEMEQLISNLLESERLSTHRSELNRITCDIADIIEEVISRHFPDLEIQSSLSPTEGLVDPFRIQLLIKNLLDNAKRYATEETRPVRVSLIQQRDQAIINISDSGPGINAEDLEHITEPFYRSDTARQRRTGGYGLGLYLCKLIVEAHSGELDIKSEIGKGTSITITLPLPHSAAV